MKREQAVPVPKKPFVRHSPIEDLEELPLPRPLPLVRQCSKRGCRRTARPGGRYCRPCATAATCRWRERHAGVLAERERSRIFSDEARLIRTARAYVAVYLKRGKLCRGRCETCGESEVLAAWDDPKRPLEVRWFCAEHYADRRETHRHAEEARARLVDEWTELRDQVALLPPDVQTELHAAALRGPAGHGCREGSPFYWWTLKREFGLYSDRQRSGGFWT